MPSAKAWGILAYRPCRHSLIVKHNIKTVWRHASSIPQTANDDQTFANTIEERSPLNSEGPTRSRRSSASYIRPSRLLSKINDDEAIISDSLSETLHAHRELNATGPVIRRVNLKTDPRPQYMKNKRVTQRQRGTSINLELTRDKEKDLEDSKDYEGKPRQLSLDWEIIGDVPHALRLPWMPALDRHGPSSLSAQSRLSAEIKVASAFLTPSEKEAEMASNVHKELELYLQRRFPGLQLDTVGSRASGLATSLSDIDFNVKHFTPGVLPQIYKTMRYAPDRDQIIQISYATFGARVPIVVGMHIKTGLEVQIQQTEGIYGSLETVKGLLAEHPNLGPLFKVLRHMLRLYGLSFGLGRITSYPLLNMIAVVLKLNPQERFPRHLGRNLLSFLDFWTEGIDLYTTGITHLPSPYVPGKFGPFETAEEYFADEEIALDTISRVVHDPVGAKPALFNVRRDLHVVHKGRDDYRMVLYDPANPYNDLGNIAHQIKHLQATLIRIRQKLSHDMSQWDQAIRTEGRMKTPSLSLLRSLLEADYTLYNLDRKRLVHP